MHPEIKLAIDAAHNGIEEYGKKLDQRIEVMLQAYAVEQRQLLANVIADILSDTVVKNCIVRLDTNHRMLKSLAPTEPRPKYMPSTQRASGYLPKDPNQRIVYGASCAWWGSITEISSIRGLPACPHCNGVLFQMDDLAEWNASIDRYIANNPQMNGDDYRALMRFMNVHHFKTGADARIDFDKLDLEVRQLFYHD